MNDQVIHHDTHARPTLPSTLLDLSDDLILATDNRLCVVYLNQSLLNACGQPAAAVLGRSVDEAGLFGRHSGELASALQLARDSGQPGILNLSWGHEADLRHYAIRVLVDAKGDGVHHVIAQARDVTVQRRIEDDLRQREHEFRTLAENWPDNIIRYGLDKRAVYCNQEIQDRVTVTAQRIVGRTPSEAAPPGMGGVQAYEAQLDRTLATGERGTVELRVPHPSGEFRVHSVVIAAERDGSGAICGAVAVGRDVTEQVRMQQALAAKEREFRTLAENSPDVIIRYGLDMRSTYCNRPIGDGEFQRPPHQVVGRRAGDSVTPGSVGVDAFVAQVERTLTRGESGTVELHACRLDGKVDVKSIAIAPERDETGAISGVIAVARDVTEHVKMQQALAAKEREFRSLAENAGDNIVRWDAEARMRYVNPAMAKLFGHAVEDLLGRTPVEVMQDPGQQTWTVQQAIVRVARDGREEMLELPFVLEDPERTVVHQIRLVPERDESGRVISVLGVGRDISEKIAHLELIESLARTDPLTKLANRQALQERMPGIFATASRHRTRVGVMLLDLDQFKSVNDTLGHSAGDLLLGEVARRLSASVRANDLLVRLGGDEFVVVTTDLDEPQSIAAITTKLHAALAAPMLVAHREFRVTASIGVAVYPQDGEGLEHLLANADTAMYHAKRSGRARTEFYRSELGDLVRRRLVMEESMREACSGKGLELYFQPQVCLQTPGRVLGAEALLRWNHPTLGLLSPDSFIALAEENGMIVPIGRWVLRTAAETAVRWNRDRAEPLHIAVNVSTRQFIDDDLAASVDEVLTQTGCEPGWLSVEITESALAQDSARIEQALVALRTRGVRVALDDFGTGYSALNYLARFPVDCLKLDKSFVWGIGRSGRDDELVKAFIAMAGALNLATVAEGIETEAQAAFLSAHGCLTAQGYRFGRPVPAERFERERLVAPIAT